MERRSLESLFKIPKLFKNIVIYSKFEDNAFDNPWKHQKKAEHSSDAKAQSNFSQSKFNGLKANV